MITYRYTIAGTATHGQTWAASGTVEAQPGELRQALDDACRAAFLVMTSGKAVYGRPGVGCAGPYRITKITMELST